MKKIMMACTAILMFFMYGCGSSSSSPAQPTSAVLKLSTTGTLPTGTSLSGIGVAIDLPSGVSVSTDATGAVSSGVVTASGVAVAGSIATPLYTPATGATPATLKFVLVSTSASGFGAGEFATVNCKIAPGSFPKSDDFSLPASEFKPADMTLSPVSGLTESFTATIE